MAVDDRGITATIAVRRRTHRGGSMKTLTGMDLLKELCETPAIPGREQSMISLMERELKKSCDEVRVDGLGNVIGVKRAAKATSKKAPPLKVMIVGHMDEIGFVVSHIDKRGFIRLAPRGGHIPKVLYSQRVRIIGRQEIIGIVEGAPAFIGQPDEMQKAAEIKNCFIDTGLRESALRKLVEVGDPIILERGFMAQGDSYISKAFDNRVGCYAVLEAARRLNGHSVEVYAVGSAQEEVGVRGARGAARAINPDLGVAIDVTGAFDTPGVAEHQYVTTMGGGVAIKINDSATISNHGIVRFMKQLAVKNRIKHQMEILPFGGTDAMGMQLFGQGPVCTLSVPTRYVHSPNEMIHKADLEATVKLLVCFLERAHECKVEF
jgi:endoglucanase